MKNKWKRSGLILGILTLVIGGAACIGAIFVLNRKINNLHETVVGLINSTSGAFDRESYLPGLDPGTDGWLITQFGDPMQQQEMCYVVTTGTGLVIIDGGYSYETPRLREIINRYGGSVEAWILTHYHPDHITAFLDLAEDPQGMEIHHIYAVEQPDLELMRQKAPWDNFSALERFRALDLPEVEYLHRGDELTLLGGLRMEVLSAYDSSLDAMTNDLMNDGSLMFRLSGREESFLFCADVGVGLTDFLTAAYGEKLKSDYIQMGHHGFGGPGEAFYRLVDPRAAFFDAPAWLMTGEGDRSAKEKETLMRDMDCVIFSYYTAPNQILLR